MTVTNDLLQEIKIKLSDEKSQIEKSLANLKRDDPFSNPSRVNDNADPGTDAFEESEHLRIEAQQETLTNQLTAIEEAQRRIEDGIYGTCSSCGLQIEHKRLMAMPTADVCISCEKKRNHSSN